MISAAFPYQKKRRRVLGSEMAYVEVVDHAHDSGPSRIARKRRRASSRIGNSVFGAVASASA